MKTHRLTTAAVYRCIRVMLETLLALGFTDLVIDTQFSLKTKVIIVAATGVFSIILSLVLGLPETTYQGELLIDPNPEASQAMAGLRLNESLTQEYLEELQANGFVTFKIVNIKEVHQNGRMEP
jgi:hypothetical protein